MKRLRLVSFVGLFQRRSRLPFRAFYHQVALSLRCASALGIVGSMGENVPDLLRLKARSSDICRHQTCGRLSPRMVFIEKFPKRLSQSAQR
jgi:hypothetical protein